MPHRAIVVVRRGTLDGAMVGECAQYLLPDALGAASASDALAARLNVEVGRLRSVDRTFYDTFDRRLHAAGLVLVHADRRLALLDGSGYAERAGDERPDPPDRVLAIDLPGGRLRDLLLPIVDVRALIPVTRIHSRARPLQAVNDDGKTVARLVIEEPTVARSGGPGVRLRPRLLVAPVRGYDKALARVRRTLEREFGLAATGELLHDEAVVAVGHTPGRVSSKPAPELRPEQRADRAATVVLARLLAAIEVNLPGTLAELDTEFLHDLRVAVRRTRSVQRQLAGVFAPEPLEHFRAEFRWLQRVTGPARDLDVHVLDFDELRSAVPGTFGRDLDPLRRVLVERRRAEHQRMGRALRSARATALVDSWSKFLDGLADSPRDHRPQADRRIGDLAGERIAGVYRGMVRLGGSIDDASPAVALHELRKKGKELRYLLELFASLYPGTVVKPMVGTLKSLQGTLGRFQDREVQAALLRSLRDEVAALDNGPAAVMAMGLVVERLERGQAAARAEFPARFAAFGAKPQRARVRRTFG
jgi:CHAD domain-containing protein